MSSPQIDYSPLILWRLQHRKHVMDAVLMPHQDYIAVVIRVNGQGRAAKALGAPEPTPCVGPKSSG
jgi:hypothetical protein